MSPHRGAGLGGFANRPVDGDATHPNTRVRPTKLLINIRIPSTGRLERSSSQTCTSVRGLGAGTMPGQTVRGPCPDNYPVFYAVNHMGRSCGLITTGDHPHINILLG